MHKFCSNSVPEIAFHVKKDVIVTEKASRWKFSDYKAFSAIDNLNHPVIDKVEAFKVTSRFIYEITWIIDSHVQFREHFARKNCISKYHLRVIVEEKVKLLLLLD